MHENSDFDSYPWYIRFYIGASFVACVLILVVLGIIEIVKRIPIPKDFYYLSLIIGLFIYILLGLSIFHSPKNPASNHFVFWDYYHHVGTGLIALFSAIGAVSIATHFGLISLWKYIIAILAFIYTSILLKFTSEH